MTGSATTRPLASGNRGRGCSCTEALVWPRLVVEAGVLRDEAQKMALAKHEDMVEQFAPESADKALGEGVHVRGPDRGANDLGADSFEQAREPSTPLLSIIRVAPLRGGHDGEAGNGCARQDPTARAGCKARRQEAVIDLPRHRKAVVAPREEVDAGEVALGADGAGRVDVAFRGGYDSVSVGVDEGDRRFVALQE